jgi:hypothetical protein
MDLKKLYQYVPYVYQCDRCGQRFPVWMASDSDWKKGITAMGMGWDTTKKFCKPCYEDFNPNPRYLTFEEYILMFHIDSPKETIEAIKDIWDLPPQHTEEKRQENLKFKYGRSLTEEELQEMLISWEEVNEKRRQFRR